MTLRRLFTALAAAIFVGAIAHSSARARDMTTSNAFFPSGPQAALEAAILADDARAITQVLAMGASVNAKGKLDVTPLMIAVDRQRPAAVKTLLEAGAKPNDKAADANGAVSLAVRSYRAQPSGREILSAILRAGGDPNSRRPDGNPVLMQFIYDHDAGGLETMKSAGADLDIADRGGDPLITSVAMAQDWDMVWALIELGARYDYENGASTQPLSKALKLRFPAPDSPLFPYKEKVWQFLKDKGITVPPLLRGPVKPTPPSP